MAKKTTVEDELKGITADEVAPANETENDEKKTRPRKLEKDLASVPGKVCITVLGGVKGKMTFDPQELSEEIRSKLIPFGLGHKLGDSAAGREGTDAEEAIEKVWEGLMKSDWTVRAPAQPKVSLKDVTVNLAALGEEEQALARQLMAKLGINIPGVTA